MTQSTSLPQVEPIVALINKAPFDDPAWTFEFKYDGFRGLLHAYQGGAYFLSKKKKHLLRFDVLARKLKTELGVTDCIIDGEIVVFDTSKRPQFLELMSQKKEAAYVAFDILWLNGHDLRDLPLTERRKRLRRILPKVSKIISTAFSVRGRGRDMFAFMCEHDLEGVIAKRFKDPYNQNVTWYKIKNKQYSQLQGRARLFHKKK
jgi:bifunctional non-homologous end joining protein LigD